MTIIAGLIHDGTVYVGADSAGVAGLEIFPCAQRKLFRNGSFLIGGAGSFRVNDVLRYRFSPPAVPSDVPIERYMVTDFVEGLRTTLRAAGVEHQEYGVTRILDGTCLLVGIAGRLFHVEADFQVGWLDGGIDATGCGRGPALGSLHATRDWPDPRARLRLALETAERFSAGVRGPFHIEALPPEVSGG